MDYTYAGSIERTDDGWFASVPSFEGAYGAGDTVGEACASCSEALGVSIGRVSQLAKGGLLDAVHIDGKRMVTIASVNARIENPPSHHRPKRS